MRKPLARDTPPLWGVKGMDRKKLISIAIGTILGTVILLVLVAVAFTALHKSPASTPTPAPTITPQPGATATPAPTATPVPSVAIGQAFSTNGPFLMRAFLNGTSGECVVSLKLANGAANVDVDNITMTVVCDGRTYDNVWTLKRMDWNNANSNSILEPDENIATIIDTVALNIPQGKPLTVKVLKNGEVLQEVSVAPP